MKIFKRKQENRKTTKRPRLYRMRRALLDWFKFGGRSVLIAGTLVGGYYFLVNSNTFRLKEVELSGAFQHTTREGIEKLAEIPFGRNLFAVNLNRLEEKIRRHPWVRRVEVRRQLPAKIRIHVEEYEPAALLRAGDDYLISREGKIFKKLRADEVGAIHPPLPSGLPPPLKLRRTSRRTGELPLPVITGFDRERLRKFPSYYRGHLEEAFSFLNLVSALPVEEVHYDVTEGITVTTANGEIYFGRGDYEEKLERWRKFTAAQAGKDAPYRRIDLHVEGKIFARM